MLNAFRVVSVIEGLSWLALLVAVYFKYNLDMAIGVKMMGPTHGALFLAYVVTSLAASHQQKWSVIYWLFILLLSIVPFGFVVAEILFKKQRANENATTQADIAQ